MEVVDKPKGRRFRKSTSTQKAGFKAPTSILEYKVLNFGKHKYAAYFVKNCESVSNYIVVNYNIGGT